MKKNILNINPSINKTKNGQRYCIGTGSGFVVIEKGLNSQKINKLVNKRCGILEFKNKKEKVKLLFKK